MRAYAQIEPIVFKEELLSDLQSIIKQISSVDTGALPNLLSVLKLRWRMTRH